jgi:hypothetical protein
MIVGAVDWCKQSNKVSLSNNQISQDLIHSVDIKSQDSIFEQMNQIVFNLEERNVLVFNYLMTHDIRFKNYLIKEKDFIIEYDKQQKILYSNPRISNIIERYALINWYYYNMPVNNTDKLFYWIEWKHTIRINTFPELIYMFPWEKESTFTYYSVENNESMNNEEFYREPSIIVEKKYLDNKEYMFKKILYYLKDKYIDQSFNDQITMDGATFTSIDISSLLLSVESFNTDFDKSVVEYSNLWRHYAWINNTLDVDYNHSQLYESILNTYFSQDQKHKIKTLRDSLVSYNLVTSAEKLLEKINNDQYVPFLEKMKLKDEITSLSINVMNQENSIVSKFNDFKNNIINSISYDYSKFYKDNIVFPTLQNIPLLEKEKIKMTIYDKLRDAIITLNKEISKRKAKNQNNDTQTRYLVWIKASFIETWE